MFADGGGAPLFIAITGASQHGASQFEALLDSIIIERPSPFERPQNFCLDKEYASEPALEAVVLRGFIPHIRSRGEEKKTIGQDSIQGPPMGS
jgi:putative transposase